MSLRDSLTPEQVVVLGEVLDDALNQAKETLKLHEDDDLAALTGSPDIWHGAEVYLQMIVMQSKRIAVIEELIAMIGRC